MQLKKKRVKTNGSICDQVRGVAEVCMSFFILRLNLRRFLEGALDVTGLFILHVCHPQLFALSTTILLPEE